MDQRLANTIEALKEAGADFGILTSPDAVAYVSGHVVPIEAGPSPFAGGPSLAIVGVDGQSGLVVTNLEGGGASFADTVSIYVGFSWLEPADIFANYLAAAAALAARMGLSGTVAIERSAFPFSLSGLVEGRPLVDVTPALMRVRAIKTEAEIEALRRAAGAVSAGQKAFLAATAAGRTELEVFADIRLSIESFAGERVPLTGDFISGRERTSAFMGWPTSRPIQPGDPLICDLAPRVAGYWGDSCASAMLGDATPAYRRLFGAAQSALSLAAETIRPGLVIGELDALLQGHITKHGYSYAHHSGHSIGTSVHEWPRIVGYERAPFRENMVVMVEPTALDPEVGGVRLEWMLLVTATGCEVLTTFGHQPSL